MLFMNLWRCLGMEFGRRDIILVVGLLLVMIGLMPVVAPIYAIIIVVLVYFGVKLFVARRDQEARKRFGPEGICMECGSKISGGRCPACDAAAAAAAATTTTERK